MSVINKDLIKDLRVQIELIDEPEKLRVIAKLTHPMVKCDWYLICFLNYYDTDNTLYCISNIQKIEYGTVGLKIINTFNPNGKPFELDESFKPSNAQELFEKLKKKVKI